MPSIQEELDLEVQIKQRKTESGRAKSVGEDKGDSIKISLNFI